MMTKMNDAIAQVDNMIIRRQTLLYFIAYYDRGELYKYSAYEYFERELIRRCVAGR